MTHKIDTHTYTKDSENDKIGNSLFYQSVPFYGKNLNPLSSEIIWKTQPSPPPFIKGGGGDFNYAFCIFLCLPSGFIRNVENLENKPCFEKIR